MTLRNASIAMGLLAVSAMAQTISFSPLTVSSTSATGTSFTYSGVLTQAATIGVSTSGLPCLQNGAYCVNGAGVVVTAGTTGVGGVSTFSGTFFGSTRTWTYGSLAIGISGVGAAEVFPVNASTGLGSGSPPTAVTLTPATLASLGFGTFSVTNPTITFFLADSLYTDNSGSFTVSPAGGVSATPVPSTLLLSLAGLAALSLFLLVRRRTA